MFDILLMLDICFLQLAKQAEDLDKQAKFIKFLKLWSDLKKFSDKIFESFSLSENNLSTKVKRQEIL